MIEKFLNFPRVPTHLSSIRLSLVLVRRPRLQIMTTAEKTARRVYSAEQLHRLRASSSAPKLHEAIEEHDGEDAELVKGTLHPSLSSLRRPSLRSASP